MWIYVLLPAAFIASFLLTGLIRRLALAWAVVDVPGARSAHEAAIPVGGGVAIVSVFFAGVAIGYWQGQIPLSEYMALLGGLLVAVLGLADDIKHLPAWYRIPVQFLSAVWCVFWLGEVPPIQAGPFMVDHGLLLHILAVMALVWLLNLYNFMDGIDGIAASEVIFVTLMSLLFVINAGDSTLSLSAGILAVAAAGFLCWNWPPAKIFMGDAGSSFIGFTLGVFALLSMIHGTMTVWTWLLLLGVFVVDATVTLFRRALNKQRWYEGHASHAYQHAAKRYKSHSKVTITMLLINILWLTPLAWVTVIRPELGMYVTLVGLLPLVLLAILLEAGKSPELSDKALV